MNTIRRAWQRFPESPAKNRIRVAWHNYRSGGAVHYSVKREVFTTQIRGVKINSYDHPFGIDKHLDYYLARANIGNGGVVIDAGAFDGQVTLFFACKVGLTGKVIAIEPDEQNIVKLRKNISINRSCNNITIMDELLWSKAEWVDFCAQGNVASSVLWKPEGKAISQRLTTTIDVIVRSMMLSRVDFIKMNIEGAEIKAIEGASDTIRRFRPDFAIASNHLVGGKYTFSAVEELLREYDYNVETIFFAPTYCYTYANAHR